MFTNGLSTKPSGVFNTEDCGYIYKINKLRAAFTAVSVCDQCLWSLSVISVCDQCFQLMSRK